MQQPTREDVQRQQMAPEPPQRAEDVVPADEPPPSPAQQEPAEPALSANANRRIRELVDELRQKDQDLQKTAAQAAEQGQTVAQLQAQMQQMQAQYDQLVQQILDHLDPETRMRVVQDARVQEMVAGMEQRILGKIAPHLQRFEQQTVRTEMERLGDRYRVQFVSPLPLTAEITAAAQNELELRPGAESWVAIKAAEITVRPG